MKFEPNGKERQCQCVRSHVTLEDKSIKQCDASAVTNGLCGECYELHGRSLKRPTDDDK